MKIREITLSEADAKVTRVGPDGVELTDPEGIKTTLPPEKMTALVPDANNPNKYSMNPQAMAADGDKPEGPKLGAEVDMATQEGMGTNILASLAVIAGLLGIDTYNQEQALKNSPQLQQLVKMHADYKAKGDEVAVKQLEKRIQLHKDRISLDKGEVMGKDGNPSPVLDPATFAKNNPTNEETARIMALAGL